MGVDSCVVRKGIGGPAVMGGGGVVLRCGVLSRRPKGTTLRSARDYAEIRALYVGNMFIPRLTPTVNFDSHTYVHVFFEKQGNVNRSGHTQQKTLETMHTWYTGGAENGARADAAAAVVVVGSAAMTALPPSASCPSAVITPPPPSASASPSPAENRKVGSRASHAYRFCFCFLLAAGRFAGAAGGGVGMG